MTGGPRSKRPPAAFPELVYSTQLILRKGSYRIDSVGIYSIARSADTGERTVLITIVQISPAESAVKPDWKIPPERHLPSSEVACSLS
jgi:hypothetical protein